MLNSKKRLMKVLILFLYLIQIIKCAETSTKVSVIIPVYNTEPFLKRCMESVIHQTLKEIEIICVDDKSTDNSLEILRSYEKKDPRIKLVHLNENKGVAFARNKGLEISNGEFIGFLDSDDYIDRRYFEYLYNHSKNYDIVVGKFVCSTNNTNKYVFWLSGVIYDQIWSKNFLNKNNLIFDINLRKHSDTSFKNEVYKLNPKILHLPDKGIYYYYKIRKGSISDFSDKFIKQLKRRIKVKERSNKQNNKNLKTLK